MLLTTLGVNFFFHLFRISSILFFLLLACSSGSSKKSEEKSNNLKENYQIEIGGSTMGTTYSIKFITASADTLRLKNNLQNKIEEQLSRFNKVFSTYDPKSEISLLNLNEEKEAGVEVSALLLDGITKAIQLSGFTKGKFDFTISPLINLWGFGYASNQDQKESNALIPSEAEIKEKLFLVNYRNVRIKDNKIFFKQEMEIDLSAIAKGRGVDEIGKFLELEGIENYLIEIGGEIRALGLNKKNQPWRVAVVDPKNSSSAATFLSLSGMSIATSGDYQNYFTQNGKRYSHILDPVTGYPIDHNLASVSVIRKTCEEADALATALLVMGEQEGINFANSFNIAAYFIYDNQNVFTTYSTKEFEKFYLQ